MTEKSGQPVDCACWSSPSRSLILLGDLGMDSRFGEVTLLICPACGQVWLRYFYENEGFSGSGRWYLGAIDAAQKVNVTAQNATTLLEGMEWYFYGGSYFGRRSGRTSGKLRI
jgi:hypothetical protein